MKKLTPVQIDARIAMYDEAINALFAYESEEPEEVKKAEFEQKQIVMQQLNSLANKFADKHKEK